MTRLGEVFRLTTPLWREALEAELDLLAQETLALKSYTLGFI
jgi:hypothetical protein